MSRINYYWRIFATGFCYTSFGIGGLILSCIISPCINILPIISRDRKRRIAQSIVHYSFRFFLWEMQFVGVLKLEISGKELLEEDKCNIIIANHPTLIDVILIISQIKEIDCTVKHEHWKNPFVRGVIKSSGYITNSSPELLLNQCVDSINNGRSLIIFPEGTRSIPGEKLKFKRGTARIALRCNKDLRPIVITCSTASLFKGAKWYQIPRDGPMQFNLSVRNKIQTAEYNESSKTEAHTARHLTLFIQEYFQKEVFSNDRFSTRNKATHYRLTRS